MFSMTRRSRIILLLSSLLLLGSCASTGPVTREELVQKGRDYLLLLQQSGHQAAKPATATPTPAANTTATPTATSSSDTPDAPQDSLPAAWTLEAAVERALSEHVDYRISQLESALATGNRKLATMDLLPKLVAQAGYQKRSAEERVTSADKESVDSRLLLEWDVLDFSVAALRRREMADQERAAEENRRRVAQLTVRDVTYAWYQALAWQALAPEVTALRADVDAALRQSDEIVAQRLGNLMQAVEYRHALLLVLRRIDQLTLQLDQARDELARLLHLPAGVVPVVDPAGSADDEAFDTALAGQVALWQGAAMLHRPEMRQALYESRQQRTSAMRRMMEVVPRLLLRTGRYRDENAFLTNRTWNQDSVQLSMDLLRLAAIPGLRRNLALSRELADLREQAMAAAVLSQVSMAAKAVTRQQSSWCLSRSLLAVDRERSALLEARSRTASLDSLSWLRSRLDSLLMRTEAGQQRAEWRQARLMLLQSAGLLEVPAGETDAGDVLSSMLGVRLSPAVREELARVAADFGMSPPGDDGQSGCGS